MKNKSSKAWFAPGDPARPNRFGLLRKTTAFCLLCGLLPCVPATVMADAADVPAVTQTNRKVKGTVLDSEGLPVIGANVVLKGRAGVGTITDMDGRFTLDVPAGATWLLPSSAIRHKKCP